MVIDGRMMTLPKTGRFRLELTAALILKVALLVGLWFVIFRFEGKKPAQQPDIAEHFQLNAAPPRSPDPDSQPRPLETDHVR